MGVELPNPDEKEEEEEDNRRDRHQQLR